MCRFLSDRRRSQHRRLARSSTDGARSEHAAPARHPDRSRPVLDGGQPHRLRGAVHRKGRRTTRRRWRGADRHPASTPEPSAQHAAGCQSPEPQPSAVVDSFLIASHSRLRIESRGRRSDACRADGARIPFLQQRFHHARIRLQGRRSRPRLILSLAAGCSRTEPKDPRQPVLETYAQHRARDLRGHARRRARAGHGDRRTARQSQRSRP